MKQVKKLISLMLTLVLVLSVSVTASAEGEHEYELYQIFTGDYANGVLSNVKWGANGTGTKGEAVEEKILEELTAVNSSTDSAKLDVIKKYVNLESAPLNAAPATSANGEITYSGLATGYYLVKDKDGSVTGNDVYTTYVVQVTTETLAFAPKGDVPEVEKKIVEGDQKVETNEASIGDTITFEITGTLPSNLADYKEYTYLLTDTLSKGLTYNEGSVSVKVVNSGAGVDVTKYFYIHAAKDQTTGEITLKVGISNLKALGNVDGVTVSASSTIVVTYTATLNEDAVIAGAGNDNKVKLSYSNDPNHSGDGSTTPPPENPKDEPKKPSGETPEQQTKTYTTELAIQKTDQDAHILTGAEFTLTGEGVKVVLVKKDVFTEASDGAYWKLKDGTYTTEAPTIGGDKDNSDQYESTETKYSKTVELAAKGTGKNETNVTGTVDETGRVTFSGLGAGTYTITETKTPAGYNTISPITFTISFDTDTAVFKTDNTSIAVEADNTLETTIENHAGSSLPSTGGMGTTVFYILGVILVVGAGVLLIVRRRMRAEK